MEILYQMNVLCKQPVMNTQLRSLYIVFLFFPLFYLYEPNIHLYKTNKNIKCVISSLFCINHCCPSIASFMNKMSNILLNFDTLHESNQPGNWHQTGPSLCIHLISSCHFAICSCVAFLGSILFENAEWTSTVRPHEHCSLSPNLRHSLHGFCSSLLAVCSG